jgi:hypothetical protein
VLELIEWIALMSRALKVLLDMEAGLHVFPMGKEFRHSKQRAGASGQCDRTVNSF